jgi:hypothetical protein
VRVCGKSPFAYLIRFSAQLREIHTSRASFTRGKLSLRRPDSVFLGKNDLAPAMLFEQSSESRKVIMKSHLRFNLCDTQFSVRLKRKVAAFPLFRFRRLRGKHHPYGRNRIPHRD